MKRCFLLALLATSSFVVAQSPPQIPLTGNIGVQGSVAILGGLTVQMPSDADYILTAAQWSNKTLIVTSASALTATRSVVSPLNKGQEFNVENSTTGGQSIQIIGGSGTGVVIPNGQTASVFSDGSDYLLGNGTGLLLNSATAQTWTQSDSSIAKIQSLSDGTVPGGVIIGAESTTGTGGVVELVGTYLSFVGTPMYTTHHVGGDEVIGPSNSAVYFMLDTGGADHTLTLPSTITTEAGVQQPIGMLFYMKREDTQEFGLNTQTIAAANGDSIEGLPSITLANHQAIMLYASQPTGALPKPLEWLTFPADDGPQDFPLGFPPTYAAGTGVTSVSTASGSANTNSSGEITVVGGAATTGTIATLNFGTTVTGIAPVGSGGTGFAVGDTVTFTCSVSNAVARVMTVSAGVAGLLRLLPGTGIGCVAAGNVAPVATSGAGTGMLADLDTALPSPTYCQVTQNGGVAYYGIGHSLPTSAGFDITAGVSVIGATFNIDYFCKN